jgi:outer membrane immunogenic protein
MKKAFWVVAAAILLSGTSAFAADVVPPAPAFDWSGPYIGIQGGYGFGTSRHYTVTIPASTSSFGTSGAFGGVTAGWNHQINKFVLGIEADYSLSGINGVTGNAPGWGCLDGCRTSIDSFGTVRARGGVALDNTMPYITGGLAVGSGRGYINADPSYTGPGSQTNIGWAAGVGIEHAFSQHLTTKIEFLHVDLGYVNLRNFGGFGVGRVDVNANIIRVGLNYKF